MNSKVVKQESTSGRESISELLGQFAKNTAAVVHDEIQLVIQGIREKVRAVTTAILTATVGVMVGFAGFLSLCAALIIGLTSYMTPVMAALLAGVVLAFIGSVIVFIGYRQLKNRSVRLADTRRTRNGCQRAQ